MTYCNNKRTFSGVLHFDFPCNLGRTLSVRSRAFAIPVKSKNKSNVNIRFCSYMRIFEVVLISEDHCILAF